MGIHLVAIERSFGGFKLVRILHWLLCIRHSLINAGVSLFVFVSKSYLK